MGDNPAGKLLRSVEGAAYWAAVAPALARLPAALGYRIACWRGDLLFRCQAGKRTELARNVRLVLGNELSPAAAQQVVRDWFRLLSCSTVDVKRLRRGARPLRRLVEIRGREHLEAALAAGKGAILCSAHFGSHASGLSVLHASGFPVTHIGRWDHNYNYDYRVNYNYRVGALIRRAVVLGTGLRQAGAALSAAAEHRAMAWPAPGRDAGSCRAPRQ